MLPGCLHVSPDEALSGSKRHKIGREDTERAWGGNMSIKLVRDRLGKELEVPWRVEERKIDGE